MSEGLRCPTLPHQVGPHSVGSTHTGAVQSIHRRSSITKLKYSALSNTEFFQFVALLQIYLEISLVPFGTNLTRRFWLIAFEFISRPKFAQNLQVIEMYEMEIPKHDLIPASAPAQIFQILKTNLGRSSIRRHRTDSKIYILIS